MNCPNYFWLYLIYVVMDLYNWESIPVPVPLYSPHIITLPLLSDSICGRPLPMHMDISVPGTVTVCLCLLCFHSTCNIPPGSFSAHPRFWSCLYPQIIFVSGPSHLWLSQVRDFLDLPRLSLSDGFFLTLSLIFIPQAAILPLLLDIVLSDSSISVHLRIWVYLHSWPTFPPSYYLFICILFNKLFPFVNNKNSP